MSIMTGDPFSLYVPQALVEYVDGKVDLLPAKQDHAGSASWTFKLENHKKPVNLVWFPWMSNEYPLPDSEYVTLRWSGLAHREDSLVAYGWQIHAYGGDPLELQNKPAAPNCGAPLVIHRTRTQARMVAGINSPPRQCDVGYSRGRMGIRYRDEVPVGQTRTYRCLVAQSESSVPDRAMHECLDLYKDWVAQERRALGVNFEVPGWLWDCHGFLGIGLQNQTKFSPDYCVNLMNQFGRRLGLNLFWGVTSNYSGPPAAAVPPLVMGELTGCCLDKSEVHKRYQPALQQLIKAHRCGFYVRPAWLFRQLDGITGATVLLNRVLGYLTNFHCATVYLDTLSGRHYGDVVAIAHLLKLMPATIIEWPTDLYPTATLLSGSVTGGSEVPVGGPDIIDGAPYRTVPEIAAYLFSDRPLFLGSCNGDHRYMGKKKAYYVERLAFMLGCKLDVFDPIDTDGKVNAALEEIMDVRDNCQWWSRRPRYEGRPGIVLDTSLIDARLFTDRLGKKLICVDNPARLTHTVDYDGKSYVVQPTPFQVIEAS